MAMPKQLASYWRKRRGKKSRSRGVRMARNNHHKVFTLPIAVVLGFTPLIARGVTLYRASGFDGIRQLSKTIVPYDGTTHRFDASELGYGLFPILAGILVHKVIGSWLGVNRALSSAHVPIIRI